jgi:chondroitin-sulfate-ABC endolyase/exolyase
MKYGRCHSLGMLLIVVAGYTNGQQASALPLEEGLSGFPERKAANEITQEEWKGMREIADRFPAPEIAPGVSTSGKNYYARYGAGLPRPETWADVTPEHLAKRGEHHLSLLCDMPRIYTTAPTEEGREKAKQFFLDQVRLTLETEDENSSSGRTYQIVRVDFKQNILAMKDVLKEEGLYDPFARVWSMYKRFMLQEHPMENMDWTRDRVTLAWALTANMDDGPEKLHRLRLLQRATNMSYEHLVTPDGGAIHHACDHISYASYSMDEVIGLAVELYGTPFQLSDETHRRLKTFAWAHGLSTMGAAYPGNLCARVGLGTMDINVEKWLHAMADMTTPPVRDLAAMYLAKFASNTNGIVGETVQRYRDAGIEPFDMNAHHSYNISAAAIHRRGDWLATIDGSREPIKAIELYAWPGTPRSFMPNSAFGSIQILSKTRAMDEQGYTTTGWDYNHYAGVTAPVLPYELLMTQRKTEQVRNGSRFGGGTSLGQNGIWGLIFSRYGQELCRKSAFCFDNRITVLSSDIQPLRKDFNVPANKRPEASKGETQAFPTHTTLFQFALTDRTAASEVNGDSVSTFPDTRQMALNQPVRLRDHMGNGYYVHSNGNNSLRVARQTQDSYNFYSDANKQLPPETRKLIAKHMRPPALKQVLEHCKPTPGDFATAWIEHKQTETRGTAAFTISVQSEPLSAPLPYRILQQDRVAHILRDTPSKTTGYVIFEANSNLSHGPLRTINRPSTVMVQENVEGGLTCSVSSTDAAADAVLIGKGDPQDPPFEAEASARSIVLNINGMWELTTSERDDLVSKHQDGNTQITIPYRDYMPVRLELRAQ